MSAPLAYPALRILRYPSRRLRPRTRPAFGPFRFPYPRTQLKNENII